jgi:colicin import membrane protein
MKNPYSHLRLRALGAALLAAALAGCAGVKPQLPETVAPPSHSVAEAEARLARAAADRARTEAVFAADEQQCYTRFMVNDCLDKAREKRREGLSGLRGIEVEAQRFIRQARVDERDRDLAKAEAEFQAEQARMAAAPPRAAGPGPSPSPAAKPGVARQKPARPAATLKAPGADDQAGAAKAAKLNSLEAADKAGAAKRAANVQAFEKRKRDSEQRQKEIAEKKKRAVSEAEAK